MLSPNIAPERPCRCGRNAVASSNPAATRTTVWGVVGFGSHQPSRRTVQGGQRGAGAQQEGYCEPQVQDQVQHVGRRRSAPLRPRAEPGENPRLSVPAAPAGGSGRSRRPGQAAVTASTTDARFQADGQHFRHGALSGVEAVARDGQRLEWAAARSKPVPPATPNTCPSPVTVSYGRAQACRQNDHCGKVVGRPRRTIPGTSPSKNRSRTSSVGAGRSSVTETAASARATPPSPTPVTSPATTSTPAIDPGGPGGAFPEARVHLVVRGSRGEAADAHLGNNGPEEDVHGGQYGPHRPGT